VPLFRIVSGAISSELALPFSFTAQTQTVPLSSIIADCTTVYISDSVSFSVYLRLCVHSGCTATERQTPDAVCRVPAVRVMTSRHVTGSSALTSLCVVDRQCSRRCPASVRLYIIDISSSNNSPISLSLPPPRRLCFHPCMSVCLLTGSLKTTDQVYEM